MYWTRQEHSVTHNPLESRTDTEGNWLRPEPTTFWTQTGGAKGYRLAMGSDLSGLCLDFTISHGAHPPHKTVYLKVTLYMLFRVDEAGQHAP